MKSFQIKTRVNFGDNALDRLAEVPYKKILIVTDPFMAKSKNLNLILDPIKKAGKEYDIFQDIVPDPPIEKISLGVKKGSHSGKERSDRRIICRENETCGRDMLDKMLRLRKAR